MLSIMNCLLYMALSILSRGLTVHSLYQPQTPHILYVYNLIHGQAVSNINSLTSLSSQQTSNMYKGRTAQMLTHGQELQVGIEYGAMAMAQQQDA